MSTVTMTFTPANNSTTSVPMTPGATMVKRRSNGFRGHHHHGRFSHGWPSQVTMVSTVTVPTTVTSQETVMIVPLAGNATTFTSTFTTLEEVSVTISVANTTTSAPHTTRRRWMKWCHPGHWCHHTVPTTGSRSHHHIGHHQTLDRRHHDHRHLHPTTTITLQPTPSAPIAKRNQYCPPGKHWYPTFSWDLGAKNIYCTYETSQMRKHRTRRITTLSSSFPTTARTTSIWPSFSATSTSWTTFTATIGSRGPTYEVVGTPLAKRSLLHQDRSRASTAGFANSVLPTAQMVFAPLPSPAVNAVHSSSPASATPAHSLPPTTTTGLLPPAEGGQQALRPLPHAEGHLAAREVSRLPLALPQTTGGHMGSSIGVGGGQDVAFALLLLGFALAGGFLLSWAVQRWARRRSYERVQRLVDEMQLQERE